MTQYLPPNLLALFAPREAIPYLPPLDKLPHEKKTAGYLGVGSFLDYFEDPKDTPPPTRVENREERLERKRREKAEQAAYKLEQDIALWDPLTNPNCTSDPYKTLFVARVNYDTSESKLRREFEVYGTVKKIHLVHDVKNGKPRGYAFIEYEHERDMHSAYKHADGKKIDGRRVLVDVERARTVKGWLPRRLGGGLGGTRRGGPEVNIKHSGREDNLRGAEERERLERESERGERAGRERPERVERNDRVEREPRRGGRGSRSRSRDRERRRKSRSRSRERPPRRDRRKRSRERSRERDKDRGRRADKEGPEEAPETEQLDLDIEIKQERKRSRSRERDRKRSRRSRSRSRSRDRDRRRRDRDRDRDKDRGDRRDRRDRSEEARANNNNNPIIPMLPLAEIKIKQEPIDDYEPYSNANGPPKQKDVNPGPIGGSAEGYGSENSADDGMYGAYNTSQFGEYGGGGGGGGEDNSSSNQYFGHSNSNSYSSAAVNQKGYESGEQEDE